MDGKGFRVRACLECAQDFQLVRVYDHDAVIFADRHIKFLAVWREPDSARAVTDLERRFDFQ